MSEARVFRFPWNSTTGKPASDHVARHRHHPAVDPLGEVRLPERSAEEELARLQVMDHVHALQHHAGDAAVALRFRRSRSR